MFNKARITLTAWYLLIIVIISVSFSFVIYNVLSHEVERFARIQRVRFSDPANFDPDLVSEVKGRIVLFLVLANGVIVIASGGLSYFLAGRTLRPIKEMVKEQNSFISNASHDLRTPISAIGISLEVALKDKDLNLIDAKEVLSACLKEVRGLQSLTDGLLQLSKFNHLSLKPRFLVKKISPLIAETVSDLNPMIKEKKLVITTQLDSNITAKIDKTKIHQLLMILLDNAIKYSSPKGKLIISSYHKDDKILISFQDFGIGISKEDIDKIFDKFYRSDKSRTNSKAQGYGLGLSIAKEIAQNHNGDIFVDSHLGEGSTFTLQLPFRKKNKI